MKFVIFDFLFPTDILCSDSAPWPPLMVQFRGMAVEILKPITDHTNHSVPGTIGNQQLDFFSTVVRIQLSADEPPDGHSLTPLARQCLAWVKVLTRQYWVGLGGTGSTSFRGSSVTTDLMTGSTEPTNFGAFSTPIFSQSLTSETWKQVGKAIASAQFPRTSDLIFCNAMLVLRDGSFQEAMALLGIACEVELADCIDSFLSARQDAITNILYERGRPDFKWKVNKLMPSLSGRDFSKDEPHWHSQLMHLYERRGKAAHGGLTSDMFRDLPRFVLATDSFLRWTHSIRSAIGEAVGPCPLSIQATSGL